MKKLPLYVALDLGEEAKALSVAKATAPYVEGFKIGPGLYFKNGPSLIEKLKFYGCKVFLDFKFFDIPSTMLFSVNSAFNMGVDMLTVHALAGEESLKRLAKLEAQLRKKKEVRILAVTVLTSFSQDSLPPPLRAEPLLSCVESLSDLALRSGLKGLVCAGHEVDLIRKKHPKAYLLTPGIRLSKKLEKGDQKRVFTPEEAIESGADALVIGRPIYESADPAGVCARLQNVLAR